MRSAYCGSTHCTVDALSLSPFLRTTCFKAYTFELSPDTHMAGPDDAAEREGRAAPTAPERGASDRHDSTAAETTKEAEEQLAMFAASRARTRSRKGTSRQRTA
jgi:hypothetical protein